MEALTDVRRRSPHIFWTIGSRVVVRLSALRSRRPLLSRKIPGTLFCQSLSRPQVDSLAGWIRAIENPVT
jgi:hypothetical protein